MTNRLEKDGSCRWLGFNPEGKYVGRIEKDLYGVWLYYDSKERHTQMWGYNEARTELREHAHLSNDGWDSAGSRASTKSKLYIGN